MFTFGFLLALRLPRGDNQLKAELKSMKLIYDGRWAGTHGIGRFASELHGRIDIADTFLEPNPLSLLSAYRLSRWATKANADLLVSPGYIPPVGCNVPFVFTIHDMNHLDVDHNSSFSKRAFYRSVILPGIHKAVKVLTVSQFSRNRIIEWANCPPSKVHVVYNGLSKAFQLGESKHKGRPYFFCCSNRKGHKNEARTIEAFRASGLSRDFDLVFSGDTTIELTNLVSSLKLDASIVFAGRLSEDALASLYQGATATVFVSLYEGFGLPIIESMACGTPVITSCTTSLPEVGGDAALYADPLNIDEIADRMRRIATDSALRAHMASAGLEQSKKFSWDKTSALVAKAIHDLNEAS